jgi:hypothetical protein
MGADAGGTSLGAAGARGGVIEGVIEGVVGGGRDRAATGPLAGDRR